RCTCSPGTVRTRRKPWLAPVWMKMKTIRRTANRVPRPCTNEWIGISHWWRDACVRRSAQTSGEQRVRATISGQRNDRTSRENRPGDAELAHLAVKRGGLHSQKLCGSAGSVDLAATFLERILDRAALDVGQAGADGGVSSRPRRRPQPVWID